MSRKNEVGYTAESWKIVHYKPCMSRKNEVGYTSNDPTPISQKPCMSRKNEVGYTYHCSSPEKKRDFHSKLLRKLKTPALGERALRAIFAA